MPTASQASDGVDTHVPERAGFLGLLRTAPYRRLLAVRFSSQWADGLFQASLGGAVLFNPERQADPMAVAAGLAVLLLPYSLISPFAGALLDRWDRRKVILGVNLLRAVLIVGVAATVWAGIDGPLLYLGALTVAGTSRFVGAGLSVALPHVVPRKHLVEANTLAVTAGAGMTAIGAVSAIGLRAVLGSGNAGSAETTLVAVAGVLLSAGLALFIRRRTLGPDQVDGSRRTVTLVLRGFVDGARASAATPSVAKSFAALAAHRLSFGITTLLILLLFRYSFAEVGPFKAGLAGIGEALGLAALGLGSAAVITPWLVKHVGRTITVRVALAVGAATQVLLALLLSVPTVMIAAFVIGATGQVLKLCADAAVQGEAGDGVLGRVFALYDIVFNVGYVGAVALAAFLSPPDGRAPWLIGAAALLYVVGFLAQGRVTGSRASAAAQPQPPPG